MEQRKENSAFVRNVFRGQSCGRQGDNLKYQNNNGTGDIFTINIAEGLENEVNFLTALLEKKDTILQDYILILEPKHCGWRNISEDNFMNQVFMEGKLSDFISNTKVHTLVINQWVFAEAFFEMVMNYNVIKLKFDRGTRKQYQFLMTLLSNFKNLQQLTFGELIVNKDLPSVEAIRTNREKEIDLMSWFGYKVQGVPHNLKLIEFEFVIATNEEVRSQFLKGIDELGFKKD